MACGRNLLQAVTVYLLWTSVSCTIIAKSNVEKCTVYGDNELRNGAGQTCGKKLVVALTIHSNEGKSQKIEANIARVSDESGVKPKNTLLENPVRIKVLKSPVLINYRLYQVGIVHNYPHEVTCRGKDTANRCRHDWGAYDWQFPCGVLRDNEGSRIFDSQGHCCQCVEDSALFRGGPMGCGRVIHYDSEITTIYKPSPGRHIHLAHALRYDSYEWYVFGLYPPQLQFKISVIMERLALTKENGEEVWEKVSVVEVGPHRRKAVSSHYQVKVEYVADFHPSSFVETNLLSDRYLLVPKHDGEENHPILTENFPLHKIHLGGPFIKSRKNSTEWLAVHKNLFDLTGHSCDRIGVGYSAFTHQPGLCSREFGSCLDNQPFLLWERDYIQQRINGKVSYMLYTFGKVHSFPHSGSMTDYQVNFIANNRAKSLLTITMVADDIRIIDYISPARLVEAYIETFQALTETGTLVIIVHNTGRYDAHYNVFVTGCSAGIDTVEAKSLWLGPNQVSNVSFTLHSYHAIGRINHCEVELVDEYGKVWDNLTVAFATEDTCFCYGECGCACGNESTTCPSVTGVRDKPYLPQGYFDDPPWLLAFKDFFRKFGPAIIAFGLFYWIISCLIGLKLLQIILSGNLGIPKPIAECPKVIKAFFQKICSEYCPRAFSACAKCCEKSFSCCMKWSHRVLTLNKSKEQEILTRRLGAGWRIPRNCNGMCKGAKFTRKRHRKLMRMNKRKGKKQETPWYQRPYRCTCKVRDTMTLCEIIKGLFFFHYCIFLPLIWTLHYLWQYLIRKYKRHKRKKRYREKRADENKMVDHAYLQLDKYVRGKIEMEILDVDSHVKKEKKNMLKQEAMGFNPEDAVELLDPEAPPPKTTDSENETNKIYASSEFQSSDTSDPDEARDIDELLVPGDPVFFNYPMSKNLPPSLQNPGKMLSVQGRLRVSEKSSKMYHFDLNKYTYQVKEIKKGKVKLLDPPKLLTNFREFEHSLDRDQALKLVTVAPLFPCLNDTTTFVMKLQSRSSAHSKEKTET